MHAKIMTRLSVLALASAVIAGCAGNSQGQNTAVGGGVGAGAGAIIGDLIGGKQGALIGTLAGGATGAATGFSWQKITSLFGDTNGTGTQATQQPDGTLKLNMPSDLSFAAGSATLNPSSGALLDKIGQTLVENPGMTARVIGYTDTSGKPQLNQTLSENRASAVADYLGNYMTAHGASPAGKISAQGFGSNNPIASNSTDFGRKQNRRVEIYLRPTEQGAGPMQAPEPVPQQ